MPRTPGQVITQILDHIPASEEEFRGRLGCLRRKVGYVAPEAIGNCWDDLNSIVNSYIKFGELEPEWKRNVVNILMDRPIDAPVMDRPIDAPVMDRSIDDSIINEIVKRYI